MENVNIEKTLGEDLGLAFAPAGDPNLNCLPLFDEALVQAREAEDLLGAGAVAELRVDGRLLERGELAIRDAGASRMTLQAGAAPVRAMLLGGEPYDEEIVMWWNFIGRTHEEVVAYRAAWQAEIDAEPARAPEDGTYDDGTPYPRFGPYPAGQPAPLPAPTLPTVQLRPRG